MTEKTSQINNKVFRNITLSETLLLAIIPFLAYLYTLVYQAGYLQAFKLPLQFVSISISDVFNIGSKVLVIFVVVFSCIYLFSIFLPKGKLSYSLVKRISLLLPIFIFAFPFLFLYEWGTLSIIMVSFLLFAIIVMFFPTLVIRKYNGTYLQKMEMLDKEIESKGSNLWEGDLLSRIVGFIGHTAFVTIVYFLLSVYLTYNAGMAAAQNQKDFYIANTSPETVVLFMTNDKIISAPFDKNTKMIEPEFFVITISDSSDLMLHLSNIGHLKLDTSSMTTLPTPTLTPFPSQTPTAKNVVTETITP